MSEFTDEQIEAAMSAALEAHDNEGFVSLLHVYAVQAPAKAQRIYDAVVNRKLTIEVPL